MSGNGSGSGSGGGGGGAGGGYLGPGVPPGGNPPPPTAANCVFNFNTHILSPNSQIIPGLTVGDVLDVGIGNAPGGQAMIVITDASGATVGAIGDHVARMLSCLQAGFSYIATVVTINGGLVTVQVSIRP